MAHGLSLFCSFVFHGGTLAAPVPVILDTDIGDDIDDTWALAMLLGCPQVDLRLIVTASDNTPTKTRLTAKILECARRTGIPLATGVKTSDNAIHQAEWLGDYDLAQYPGAVVDDGVQAIVDAVNASKEAVTLMVIGPQTNIKAALARDPGIARKARVVAMAGSVYIGYNGQEGRVPEWNVIKDVAAAKAVFAAPWDITMAPLDVCGTLRLTGERYQRVVESSFPRAAVTIDNYNHWSLRKEYLEGESSVLFDTVAAYLTFDDALCEMKTIKLTVDDKGNTVPDDSGRPVRCALGWKNRDAFEELLVEAMTRE